MSRTGVAEAFRASWASGHPETAVPELLPLRLAVACAEVLPVSGAGLGLISDDFRVPLGGSDGYADIAERLQFTQGEGPCLDGARSGRLVVADIEQIGRRWPVFAEELFRHTPYRTVVSVPLPLTEGLVGALDLYLCPVDDLSDLAVADISVISEEITDLLLTAPHTSSPESARSDEPEPAWLHGPTPRARSEVWMAIGIVMARMGVVASAALAVLRGYAYSADTTLDQLAADLLDGKIETATIADRPEG